MAFAGYLVLAALFIHDWDGYVFATAVRQFWDGQSPYSIAPSDPWYGYLNVADQHVQWYAYPPLPLLAMALTYAPSVFFDLPPPVDRILLKMPMILGTLALAAVAGRWTRRLGGSDDEVVHIERRFLTNPYLILVGPVWGMTDTALMALCMGGLLLLAHGRARLAGIFVALSILVKPFPLLLLMPLIPYYARRDGWPTLRRFGASAAVTGAIVCLPFIIASPAGFWRQAVGGHLARDPQGLTVWSLYPLSTLSPAVVAVASLAVMAAALLAIGWAATRISGRGTTLVVLLAAAIAVLVANRVVNEQYLVMVVAPMLVLDVAHRLDRFSHVITHVAPTMFAAAIVLVGYHFLTFIPPDIALPIFTVPVDVAAFHVRAAAPAFWRFVETFFAVAVPLTILLLGIVAFRLLRASVAASAATLAQPGIGSVGSVRSVDRNAPARRGTLGPTAAACAILFLLAIVPVLQPTTASVPAFQPAHAEARVAAFYYLWWQNPAHDPAVRYGNWEVVSQVPEMGYYTNTRGVAREHAQMMVDAGIDTAVVSYHRGELERYRIFQEEASKVGLRVAPLIELNQVYDQDIHHPVNSSGERVRHAAYRLDPATQDAIASFVLDLKDELALDSTLRIDGAPVVMFYDSYVSAVSYWQDDRERIAKIMVETNDLEVLRHWFRDPSLNATVPDMLRHYPRINDDFYREGAAALWRLAHLEEHRRFWIGLRERIESETGPLHLVSGDAVNERAGFEFGTIKLLVGLDVMDGSFIYSPSFTWGTQPAAPFDHTFALWEDRNLWLTAVARSRDATSAFGVGPAYDDTVNRERGFIIPAFPANHTRSFYELSWDSTLREPPTLPIIATFNEFFEGSSIEPSEEYGDVFLGDTASARSRLETPSAVTREVAVLLHERSSRTSLYYPETDLSHFWGLDMLAAALRTIPDAQFTAVDALEADPTVPTHPALLIVEGGRREFEATGAVVDALSTWLANSTPMLLFGSDVAAPVDAALGENCLSGLQQVQGPQTLIPGDNLSVHAGRLMLTRNGTTYFVGQTCDGGLRAGTTTKPWVATEPILQPWGGAHDATNRDCVAVTLRALMPDFAPRDAPQSCVVPPAPYPPGLIVPAPRRS